MKHRHLFSAILTFVLMVALLLPSAVHLAIPAGAAPQSVTVTNGTGTRGPIGISGELAYRAIVQVPFSRFGFSMPTWTTKDSAAELSLYIWKGTYKDTMKADPLVTKRFDPLVDNALNWVDCPETPAGEYLFCIHKLSGQVGVWANTNPTDPVGFLYEDGMEKLGDPELRIQLDQATDQPFKQCEPSVKPVDGNHVSPPPYVLPEDSLIYTHEVMPDTWVFTDGLGRKSLTNADVGDPRDDKTVGIFYWTWHTGHHPAFNNQKFLEQHPEALHDFQNPLWPKVGEVSHAWNEPIYGHYKNTDAWVVRRQGELLANAGIDAILTDNTNGTFTWRSSYHSVFETWSKAMDDGVKTPKVSFMLPFGPGGNTKTQLRDLYLDFYRNDDYQKLWFYWDDKPVIMAHGRDSLNRKDLTEKEIFDFFCFRPGYPGYSNSKPKPGQWGWLSVFPQAVYHGSTADKKAGAKPEQTTVGVAMNHNYKLHALSAMNGDFITGRSYTSAYPDRFEKEGPSASLWGYNLAEQFDYAIEQDPRFIFITGWNEWIAGRYESWPPTGPASVKNAFPDQCNDEFSRDIEPTKGALKDHYYYQTVNYIRKYKGCRPIPTPSLEATVDITKDNAQWQTIEPYYAAYIGNTGNRDAEGYASSRYTEYSGRNDIIGARVARDADHVYFYVECQDNITPYTDPLWMTLYIDSDQENQGWETFDYVLNKKSPTDKKAYLERFTGTGYETEPVGEVDYTVNGRYMQVKIPKSLLKLDGYNFTINFTWTDNVHDEADKAPDGQTDYAYTKFSGDIMDFYISGDVAPSGRFKYSYISTTKNATGEEEETTVPDSESATDPAETPTDPAETPTDPAETPTDAPVETPTDAPADGETTEAGEEKKGCASVVGMIPVLGLTAMAAGAVLLRKKKRP